MYKLFKIPEGSDVHQLAAAISKAVHPEEDYDGAYGPYWDEQSQKYQLESGNNHWLREDYSRAGLEKADLVMFSWRYSYNAEPYPDRELERAQKRGRPLPEKYYFKVIRVLDRLGYVEVESPR